MVSGHVPPPPHSLAKKGCGSHTDPAQSTLWAVLQPPGITFTHTASHSIFFLHMLLPHKLLFTPQNPAQISPSLRSLSSHRHLRNFFLCWSLYQTSHRLLDLQVCLSHLGSELPTVPWAQSRCLAQFCWEYEQIYEETTGGIRLR